LRVGAGVQRNDDSDMTLYYTNFRNGGFESGVLGNRSLLGRDDDDAPVLQGSLQPQIVRNSVGRDHVRALDIQRTVQQQQPDVDRFRAGLSELRKAVDADQQKRWLGHVGLYAPFFEYHLHRLDLFAAGQCPKSRVKQR
jgi:hypothetical protein